MFMNKRRQYAIGGLAVLLVVGGALLSYLYWSAKEPPRQEDVGDSDNSIVIDPSIEDPNETTDDTLEIFPEQFVTSPGAQIVETE